MTDKKIKDLARKYVEEVYNGDTDFIDEALSIIGWLLLDHCIVSQEKVKALEANIHGNIMYAHDEDDWQEAAHYILDVMPRRFTAIFGTELFEERSGK